MSSKSFIFILFIRFNKNQDITEAKSLQIQKLKILKKILSLAVLFYETKSSFIEYLQALTSKFNSSISQNKQALFKHKKEINDLKVIYLFFINPTCYIILKIEGYFFSNYPRYYLILYDLLETPHNMRP